jgi:hypothetical protein
VAFSLGNFFSNWKKVIAETALSDLLVISCLPSFPYIF